MANERLIYLSMSALNKYFKGSDLGNNSPNSVFKPFVYSFNPTAISLNLRGKASAFIVPCR